MDFLISIFTFIGIALIIFVIAYANAIRSTGKDNKRKK